MQRRSLKVAAVSLAAIAMLVALAGLVGIAGDRWLFVRGAAAPDGSLLADAPGEPQWQVVDRYCSGCHNEIDLAGGLAFEGARPPRRCPRTPKFGKPSCASCARA